MPPSDSRTAPRLDESSDAELDEDVGGWLTRLVREEDEEDEEELASQNGGTDAGAEGEEVAEVVPPTEPMWSDGSEGHPDTCLPCAWFWKGCRKGAECVRCHMCPEGELKRRVKEKKAEKKRLAVAAAADFQPAPRRRAPPAELTRQQQALLEERRDSPNQSSDGSLVSRIREAGTSARAGFWLKAMQRHPAFGDMVQEWDEAVLQFLSDIEKVQEDHSFKLIFHFEANPFFSNTELTKEYICEDGSPDLGEVEVKEIQCSTIEWNEGKNVTVEWVVKRIRGGGAKKQKQKADFAAKGPTEKPRPSVFRHFFRSMHPGMELQEDGKEMAQAMMPEHVDADDDTKLVEMLMQRDYEMGAALREAQPEESEPLEAPTASQWSLGSEGHPGSCKPCAWFWRGCMQGEDCSRCHLCPERQKKVLRGGRGTEAEAQARAAAAAAAEPEPPARAAQVRKEPPPGGRTAKPSMAPHIAERAAASAWTPHPAAPPHHQGSWPQWGYCPPPPMEQQRWNDWQSAAKRRRR